MPEGGGTEDCHIFGNYLALAPCQAGDRIEVSYPLPITTEEATVGNPGYRQWRYRVTWKGDTVVRIAPLGASAKTGFSDFDGKQVDIFYGTEGPGPLYQRESMLTTADPKPAPLHLDDGSLDFWLLH